LPLLGKPYYSRALYQAELRRGTALLMLGKFAIKRIVMPVDSIP